MAVELATAYVSVVPSVQGIKGSLAKAMSGADSEAAKAGKDAGGKFSGAFKVAAVAAGAVAVAGFVKAMNVEAVNDKLSASLGLTKKQSKRAGKAAGSLYSKAYGESIGEVSAATEAVMSSMKGMRNASAPEIEAMTKNVLNMASAFEIDTARAAQVAGQMITTGLAKDGKNAADLLTASLQAVPKAVREDVLDAVDEYGPFMEQIGLSGEKSMGLLVAASEKGMFGIDKTGDAIKEFGIRATDMSKLTGEAYDTLGMDQGAMTEKLLKGGETGSKAFQKIVTGLQDVKNPAARSQAAIALFGTPLEDLSVNEIPKFLGSLTGAKGGLKDVAGASKDLDKQLNDNAKTTITEFGRTLQTKFVKILGEKVIPAVKDLMEWLDEKFIPAIKDIYRIIDEDVMPALKRFADWFKKNKGTIGIIATVITAVLIPALALLVIQAGITAAKTALAFLIIKGSAIKAAAVFVLQSYKIVAGWVLMGVQSLRNAARMAAAWFIALGPIGWVIAAVVGLAALIILNWDKISKWTKKAWSAVSGFVSDAWDNIKEAVSFALRWVKMWIKSKMWEIQARWHRAWTKVKRTVSDAWENIKDGIKGVWNKGIKPVFNALKDFITKTIPNAFERGINGIKKFWNRLEKIAKAPVKFVVETVLNKGLFKGFNNVMDFIGSDLRIKPIQLPPGFAKGGKAPKGWAMVGEEGPELVNFTDPGRVYTARQTSAAMDHREKGSAALGPISGSMGAGGFTPIWGGFQNSIRSAKELNVGAGAGSAWQIPAAAAAWDRLAGLRVRSGRGSPQASTSVGALDPSILAWATGAGNITFNNQGLASGFSRQGKLATSIHEIGHVLGLPHDMGASIMQPRIGKYMMPTGRDKSRLSSMYGEGSKAPGEGGFNPLAWVAEKVIGGVKKLIDQIPGAGMIVDLVSGLMGKVLGEAKDWALRMVSGEDARDKGTSTGTNKFGATLHDQGGMVGTGRTLIENRTRKPEALLNAAQWNTAHRSIKAVERQAAMPDVYVQNPFTGEYLLAKVDYRADRAVTRADAGAGRRRAGI